MSCVFFFATYALALHSYAVALYFNLVVEVHRQIQMSSRRQAFEEKARADEDALILASLTEVHICIGGFCCCCRCFVVNDDNFTPDSIFNASAAVSQRHRFKYKVRSYLS